MQALTEELYTYRQILFPATRIIRIFIHVIFWCIFLGLHLLFFVPRHPERLQDPVVVMTYILYYGRYIPLFYLMVYFFRYLRDRVRGIIRLVLLAVFVLVCYHLITTVLFYYYQARFGLSALPDGFQMLAPFYLDPFASTQGKGLGVLIYDLAELQLFLFPVCVKTLKYSLRLVMDESGRQQQKLRDELKYLRFQLTPHFILGVITAASTELARSPKKLAASYLLQAADMIRFSIYDIEQEFVPLEKELRYVQQYLKLEAARTAQRSEIFFVKKGALSPQHQVPTLLLVTLVENAFKHGVHATHEPSQVRISSEVNSSEWLVFEVVNSKSRKAPAKKPKQDRSGIGLANIQKTLSLKFRANHRLEIKETGSEFSVLLAIPLLAAR